MKNITFAIIGLLAFASTAKSQTEFNYNTTCGEMRFYTATDANGKTALLQLFQNDTIAFGYFGNPEYPYVTLYGNNNELRYDDSLANLSILVKPAENGDYSVKIVSNQSEKKIVVKEASAIGYHPVESKCFEAHRMAKVQDGGEEVEVWLNTSRSLLLADGTKNDKAAKLNELFLKVYTDKTNQVESYPLTVVKNKDILLVQDFSSVYESAGNEDDYIVTSDWNVEEMMNMNYVTRDMITVSLGMSEYTGGAHGFYGAFYTTYDLTSGKTIGLDDIFTGNYKEILLKRLEESRKIYYKTMEEEYIEDSEFFISDNFYITPQSIIFAYNPYEAGPFSMGIIELEISISELKDIINPGFMKKLQAGF